MTSELEKAIAEERALITALDLSLDNKRTPYMKMQLGFANNRLDDAGDGLRFAAKAAPNYVSMWYGFAGMNIKIAAQIRQQVQSYVDQYGGPTQVMEVGG